MKKGASPHDFGPSEDDRYLADAAVGVPRMILFAYLPPVAGTS